MEKEIIILKQTHTELYTVSEFAKRTNVTTETLRYYHRIGLLEPSYVNEETGYRYYTLMEFETVGVIQALQSLGVPLNEIKNHLKTKTLTSSYDLLSRQYQQICQKLDSLKQIQTYLKDKLTSMDSLLVTQNLNTVYEKKYHTRSGYYSLTPLNSYASYQIECAKLMEVYDKNLFLGNSFYVLCKPISGGKINFFSLITNIKKPMKTICKKLTLPTSNYVCIQYSGSFEDCAPALQAAFSYMKEHKYRQSGEILMLCLVDENYTNIPNEHITEIQIPFV